MKSLFKILVVEDDFHIRNIMKKHLEMNAFHVVEASDGNVGYQMFVDQHIDLIITDIMMPKTDGQALVKRIRQHNKDIPIMMLTALSAFHDKEMSFTNGADDYLVKPVDMKELLLRVKAHLRRAKHISNHIFTHKKTTLNYQTQTCVVEGKEIELSMKEFQLLFKLISSDGIIFTREQLMNEIWGYDSESYERTVDTHIKRLREKVISNDFEIKTIRGLGYKVVLL